MPTMKSFRQITVSLLRSEDGATAIEYALVASLIAMVIIGGVTAIGTALETPFSDVADGLS
jgi:pilus assembly protein Flp/PilA